MLAAMQSGGNAVVQTIIDTANRFGIDPAIPLSIGGWETRGSYNPNSVNKTDWNGLPSVGVFQLNTGGVGAGYTVGQLENPQTNATLAIQAMLPAYKRSQALGLTGTQQLDYVANNSGWPLSTGVSAANASEPSYDAGLNKFYLQGNFAGSGNGSPNYTGMQYGPADPNAPVAFASGTDPISVIDKSTKLQGFSITNPAQSIAKDAGAIALRSVLVVIGFLCITFGLLAVVKKTM